MQLSVPPTLKC